MATKRIIPCLDVNMGRVVKGKLRKFKRRRRSVEIAQYYNEQGADELVF